MNIQQMPLEVKQDCFNAFIEEFKENSLVDKQQIIIYELKELIALFQKLCSANDQKIDLLVNREIVDVNKDTYTQDDFAEAVYTYMQMFKEILSEYMLSQDNKFSESQINNN